MLNRNAVGTHTGLKVVQSKEEKQVEKHVKFYSPRSGKRYRFYYQRFIKSVTKLVVGVSVVAVVGYFMLDLSLKAWDKEHDMRMERQQEWMQQHEVIDPEPMSSETFKLIYGEGDGQ